MRCACALESGDEYFMDVGGVNATTLLSAHKGICFFDLIVIDSFLTDWAMVASL